VGKLVLYMPDGSTREICLTKERVTIGRRADNDIALPFPAVSGEHAAVVTILSDSFLEDLGSTNGTHVNGKSVTKHFLRDRDRLDIGRKNLVYYADNAALPEPLPQELLDNQAHGLRPPLLSYSSDAADAILNRRSAAARDEKRDKRRVVTEFDSHVEASDSTERMSPFRAVISGPSEDDASVVAAPAATQSIDTQADGATNFMLKVMTGAAAGREIALSKREFSLGRIGLSVAMLKLVDDKFWLIAVEGVEMPRHNGAPIPPQGAALMPGDKFEVAGTALTLVRR
jgi:pSer/pThr/pTyr-binding forkhead associated (FHA) protein